MIKATFKYADGSTQEKEIPVNAYRFVGVTFNGMRPTFARISGAVSPELKKSVVMAMHPLEHVIRINGVEYKHG